MSLSVTLEAEGVAMGFPQATYHRGCPATPKAFYKNIIIERVDPAEHSRN